MSIQVTTASGRQYDIDLDGKRFRTVGDQKFGEVTMFGVVDAPDPHHDWTHYRSLDVDEGGRLYIVEADGSWRQSTRVVVGLVELVDALDGAS